MATVTPTLDPNLHPVRADLAAERYRGVVEADRFATPAAYQVTAGVCPVRKEPVGDGEQLSQALHGDQVDIYEERDGFGWGQMLSDGYVGWFDMEALSAPVNAATHRVVALRTYGYSGPSVKAAPHFLLSMNATVTVTGETVGNLVFCGRSGWIAASHLAPVGTGFAADPVAVAEQFHGAPYQWGGRESLGLDCSGLVQTAHIACGIAMPRDSYMQREVGEAVDVGPDLKGLKRGDIVCWRGHVALMVDADRIIHANGYHTATVIEPLAGAVERIAAQYGALLTVRRLG